MSWRKSGRNSGCAFISAQLDFISANVTTPEHTEITIQLEGSTELETHMVRHFFCSVKQLLSTAGSVTALLQIQNGEAASGFVDSPNQALCQRRGQSGIRSNPYSFSVSHLKRRARSESQP